MKESEEEQLTNLIKDMADAGFAPTSKQLLSLVREFSAINDIKDPKYNTNISYMAPFKTVVVSIYETSAV